MSAKSRFQSVPKMIEQQDHLNPRRLIVGKLETWHAMLPNSVLIAQKFASAEQGPKLGTPLTEGPVMGPSTGAQGYPQAALGLAQG
jgi:hypothetical protein